MYRWGVLLILTAGAARAQSRINNNFYVSPVARAPISPAGGSHAAKAVACLRNELPELISPVAGHYSHVMVHPQLPAGIGRPAKKPAPARDKPHFGEAIGRYNSPSQITQRPAPPFESLAKSVDLSHLSWGPRIPGVDAWSYAKGGIARPATGQAESPAVKYDQVFHRPLGQSFWATRYDATEFERWAHSPAANPEYWYGHCDGLATAEALCPRPRRNVDFWVPNGSGGYKLILFTPEDVMALVSEALTQMPRGSVGRLSHAEDERLGADSTGRPLSPNYRDVNPAAYHVVRASEMSQGRVIVVDDKAGTEVQNKPVYGYRNRETYLSPAEAQRLVTGQAGAYAFNPAAKQFVRVQSTELLPEGPRQLDYVLELDARGVPLGGEWIGASRYAHPDGVWVPKPEKLPALQAELPGAPSNNPGVNAGVVMQLLKMSAGP